MNLELELYIANILWECYGENEFVTIPQNKEDFDMIVSLKGNPAKLKFRFKEAETKYPAISNTLTLRYELYDVEMLEMEAQK